MPALTRLTHSRDPLPPLLALSAAFLIGVLWSGVPDVARLAGAPLIVALLWLIGRDWLTLLLALAFTGGLLRGIGGEPSRIEPESVLRATRPIELRGVVSDYPDPTSTGDRYVVDLRSAGQAPARGRIQIQTAQPELLRYGDLISFQARPRPTQEIEPAGWRDYLIRQGIAATAFVGGTRREAAGQGDWYRQGLANARDRLGTVIDRALPSPERELARGLTLGDRGTFAADLSADLRRSGLSHLVVVSGFNMILVVGAVWVVVGALAGRRPAFWLTIPVAAGYAILTGLEPPIVRAGLIAALAGLGWWLGRPVHLPTLLAGSAALLALHDPRILGDLSFLLSFAATGALLLFLAGRSSEADSDGRWPVRLATNLREVVLATLVASLATAPILLSAFGMASLVAPISNALVAPIVPVATLSSVAVAAAGWLNADLGRLVAVPTALILKWIVVVAEWTAQLPGATVTVPAWRPEWAWPVYGGLALLVWHRGRY